MIEEEKNSQHMWGALVLDRKRRKQQQEGKSRSDTFSYRKMKARTDLFFSRIFRCATVSALSGILFAYGKAVTKPFESTSQT